MPERRSEDLGVSRYAPGGVKELRSYEFRRAFIDELRGKDLHPKIVQELLGHATVVTAVDMMRKGK